MNAEALLALIADLYTQLAEARSAADELRVERDDLLAVMVPKAEGEHLHPGNCRPGLPCWEASLG